MTATPNRDTHRDDHDHPAAVAEYLQGHHARCPSCRYDLFGTDGRACPECGLALSERVFQTRLKPSHDERVAYLRGLCDRHRIPCPACDQTITRPADLACPTCHTPLDPWSITPARASPRVLLGIVLLIAGITFAPALLVLALWLLNLI